MLLAFEADLRLGRVYGTLSKVTSALLLPPGYGLYLNVKQVPPRFHFLTYIPSLCSLSR